MGDAENGTETQLWSHSQMMLRNEGKCEVAGCSERLETGAELHWHHHDETNTSSDSRNVQDSEVRPILGRNRVTEAIHEGDRYTLRQQKRAERSKQQNVEAFKRWISWYRGSGHPELAELYRNELKKCTLLCREHHRQVHNEHRKLLHTQSVRDAVAMGTNISDMLHDMEKAKCTAEQFKRVERMRKRLL